MRHHPDTLSSCDAHTHLRMLRLLTMPTRLREGAFPYPPSWLTFRLLRLLRQTGALSTVVLVFAAAMWWVVRVQDFPGLNGVPFINAPNAVTWPVFWQLPGASVAGQLLWSVFNSISAMIGNTFPPAPPVTFAEMWVWLTFEVTLTMQWIFVGGCVVAVLFSPNKPSTAYLRLIDEVKVRWNGLVVDVCVWRRWMPVMLGMPDDDAMCTACTLV